MGDPNAVEAHSFHATELNAAQKFWGSVRNSVDAASLAGDARPSKEKFYL
jgi:hypothetical protein